MDRVNPVVASVGTMHPLNVAGIGLDARIAAILQVRIVSVVAGITAQDARRVIKRTPVDAATIAAQFQALRDARIGAFHVGALLDAAGVRAVARGLHDFPTVPVVCDPVIAASGGDMLADGTAIAALRDDLFGCCTLVTPNLAEAAVFADVMPADVAAMERAAAILRARTGAAVLVKGGHLEGDAVDVLADADGTTSFRSRRIEADLRGTGDLLAFAISSRLAYGDDLRDAVAAARAFVRDQIIGGESFAGTRAAR
ncbi:MAG: hydroxymethylpyrimidine/phosphomethylpyrimidine kinase [Candidatus Velthaea sp.]